MADILSEQFKLAFSKPAETLPTLKRHNQPIMPLTDIEITDEAIIEAAHDMKATSAPGPDGISALLIKTYIKELLYPIKKCGENHSTLVKCQKVSY